MGLVLTGKLAEYVEKRRGNMEYLKQGLADCAAETILDERPETKCAPYAAFATVDLSALRVARDGFVKAIAAELTSGGGVAVRTGAYPAINESPVLTQGNGYGGKPCPMKCPWYQGSASYPGDDPPNATRFRDCCMVFEVHPTIGPSDLDDVIEAVRKVADAYCV